MSAIAQPLPWYARPAAFTVLGSALVMSAPGEYGLATLAGWSPWVAWLMPVCVSVYAAVAALFVDSAPKGARGRGTAILGAAGALAMALAAQVTAHWIAAGYLGSSMALVGAVSAVPPVVVAHVLHMVTRATPETRAMAGELAKWAVGLPAQEAAMEEPEAAADSTPDVQKPEAAPLPPAKLKLVPGAPRQTDADPLPGLDELDQDQDQDQDQEENDDEEQDVTPAKSARSVEEIREAVAKLMADGKPVTGTTYGRLVGVSARTGRRDLKLLAA
ncbi:hypothetical protein [Streptomyces sp. URMC 124]|uniref:hypothetical protein n=1 Tax=Streptomyces sp. URMC 124 TaxID=3423405 RepID=UPI003F1CAFAD